MAAHLPRHGPMEALRSLIAAPPEEKAKSYLEYVGAFSTTANTEKTRPTNLLDLYATDIREIYLDVQRRPGHYDERQKEIVESLMMSLPLKRQVTDQEKNDLLITYMQRTVNKEERERKALEEYRQRKKREQEENDEIVLEDGRTLSESIAEEKARQEYEGIFEKQDFGDKIIV